MKKVLQPSQVGSALAPAASNGADEFARRELRKLRLDLGAVVSEALDNPRTVEVLLNADGRLWEEQLGQPMQSIGRMEPWQSRGLDSHGGGHPQDDRHAR